MEGYVKPFLQWFHLIKWSGYIVKCLPLLLFFMFSSIHFRLMKNKEESKLAQSCSSQKTRLIMNKFSSTYVLVVAIFGLSREWSERLDVARLSF